MPPSPASSPFFFQPGFLSSLWNLWRPEIFSFTLLVLGSEVLCLYRRFSKRLYSCIQSSVWWGLPGLYVCFNSVFCVVIFDGHFALSGHHLVYTCRHFVRTWFSFPVPSDQGSQEHLSRPSLTPETEGKGEKTLKILFISSVFFIN